MGSIVQRLYVALPEQESDGSAALSAAAPSWWVLPVVAGAFTMAVLMNHEGVPEDPRGAVVEDTREWRAADEAPRLPDLP